MKPKIPCIFFLFLLSRAIQCENIGRTTVHYRNSVMSEYTRAAVFNGSLILELETSGIQGQLLNYSAAVFRPQYNVGIGRFRRTGPGSQIGHEGGSFMDTVPTRNIQQRSWSGGRTFDGIWIHRGALTGVIYELPFFTAAGESDGSTSAELILMKKGKTLVMEAGAYIHRNNQYSLICLPYLYSAAVSGPARIWFLVSPAVSNYQSMKWDASLGFSLRYSVISARSFLRYKEEGYINRDFSVTRTPLLSKTSLTLFPESFCSLSIYEYLRYRSSMRLFSREVSVRNKTSCGVSVNRSIGNKTLKLHNDAIYFFDTEELREDVLHSILFGLRLSDSLEIYSQYSGCIFSADTEPASMREYRAGARIETPEERNGFSHRFSMEGKYTSSEYILRVSLVSAKSYENEGLYKLAVETEFSRHKCKLNIEGTLFW